MEASRLQVQVQTTLGLHAYVLPPLPSPPPPTHTPTPTFPASRVCSKRYTCTESSDKTGGGAWRGLRVPT